MTMKFDLRSSQPVSFSMTRPDDWHLHVRDGDAMKDVVGYSARQFARAIIMPNLKPPVTTVDQAHGYYVRICDAVQRRHPDSAFQPLMTLYLTDNTSPDEIDRAKESGIVHGVKYYPAGATTNSDAGVTDIQRVFPVLERMQELGMPLLVHGEATEPQFDIFDREREFIERVLCPVIVRWFSKLKIVLEHITTACAVEYLESTNSNVCATITAHHLLCNRNHLLVGGIKPHLYCLPILKTERDRLALLRAATSGSPRFFLGTDSAPHARHLKEHACGCAGCFTAPYALPLYAEAFESVGKLNMLEGFASFHGADFYGLPRNTDTVTLVREPWQVSAELPFGDSIVVPFRASETLQWKMK